MLTLLFLPALYVAWFPIKEPEPATDNNRENPIAPELQASLSADSPSQREMEDAWELMIVPTAARCHEKSFVPPRFAVGMSCFVAPWATSPFRSFSDRTFGPLEGEAASRRLLRLIDCLKSSSSLERVARCLIGAIERRSGFRQSGHERGP
jgi:hypothetical protein